MKKLSYEDWQKNPKPRMMWAWDDDETCKEKIKVIYVTTQDVRYPIIALADNDIDLLRYKHCAEIAKTRRMTNKELARWLREKPTREFKYSIRGNVHYSYPYEEIYEDKEVDNSIVVREDYSEWREPFVEADL